MKREWKAKLPCPDGSINIVSQAQDRKKAYQVCKVWTLGDAELIIRAVNSHYALVEACLALIESVDLGGSAYFDLAVDKAKKALKLAGE